MSATAASVIGLAAAPALAAASWTVKPGGTVAGTAGTTTVTDTTAGASVTCTSSVAKGTLKKGSGLAGAGIGTIASLAFKSCNVSGVSVSLTVSGKMLLNAVKYSGTTKIANMTITKIHGTLSASSVGCTATIDGTSATAHNGMVTAKFSNKTDTLQVLATGSTLKLYNVSSGCAVGNIHTGDAVNFTGSYKLAPKQTITSP